MHLIPHVFQYLQLHKKIAISGLGVFYLKRVNGFLDEDSHTVFPPSIKVKFDDKEVLDNDFAQYISNQSQIGLEKVIYYIEKLVREIKKEVESGSAYLLENIGSLEQNRGNIRLINSDNAIYNQAFFGLKTLTYKPIEQEQIIQPSAEKEIKPSSVLENLQPEIPATIYIQPLTEKEIEVTSEAEQLQQDFSTSYSLAEQALNSASISEDQPKSTYNWLWISVLVLIAVAILGAIGYYFSPFNQTPVKKVLVKKEVPIVHKVELPQQSDSVINHEVIIAENLSAIDADKLIVTLKIKGIDAHLITDSLNSDIKISAAQFTNIDSAEAKLKNIQQQYYPKAYLQTIKSIK